MTWVDWIILALTLLMVLSGLARGPLRTLLETCFLALAFGLTSRFYKAAAQALFGRDFPWPEWAATVTFLGMLVVLVVVGNYLTAAIAGRGAAAGVQILLGGLLGVLKGAVLSMIFLVFLLAAPFGPAVRPDVERSLLAPTLASWEATAVRSLNGVLPWKIPELGPGGESF
ncbi:MAG: CvpA family protein [Armatimonadetes bacterium]|nr:CvpA family protein [Armatimonadota bacterium]MDW8152918.1 CvpA family protein [Armatimonadota bacterium]